MAIQVCFDAQFGRAALPLIKSVRAAGECQKDRHILCVVVGLGFLMGFTTLTRLMPRSTGTLEEKRHAVDFRFSFVSVAKRPKRIEDRKNAETSRSDHQTATG